MQQPLIDKISALNNLGLAFGRVKKNGGAPGVDRQTVEQFDAHREENLQRLSREISTGNYRPQPVRQRLIPKEGTSEMRHLGIPTVRDRVVHTSTQMVLEPFFEPDFADGSYAYQKGRSPHDALRHVEAALEDGHNHVLVGDIEKFFDTINHTTLLDLIQQKVKEEQTLRLIEALLKAGALKGGHIVERELGTPQGGPLSPFFSNVFLTPLDHDMVQQGFHMARFADDFRVLCSTQAEAERAKGKVEDWLQKAGLSLNQKKTEIVDFGRPGGFNFLGYHFDQEVLQPRRGNLDRLREKVGELTKRSRKEEPEVIIEDLNRVLVGWIHYFQLTTNPEPFLELDAWIRKRISNIQCLRRRRYEQYLTNLITRELLSLHGVWKRLRSRRLGKVR
jgi:RNA-directed DNA polymerase